MGKLRIYLLAGLAVFSLVSGLTAKALWDETRELKSDLEILETERKEAEKNLLLVSDQLARERVNRQIAEQALINLKDIPDADFNQPLPDSVSDVLDQFHQSLGGL